MQNLIGQTIARYHILEQLGEGGMATVYKAYDTRLEADVAVKVIRTENFPPAALERVLKRFEHEAKALARLTHPNIVKVTDYGEHEGHPYLVMPYLPGGDLKQLLKQRSRLSWQEAAILLMPIVRALEFAHSQKVIHRDVKPSNILITQSGEPILTDFGVAKVIEEEATVDLTGTSMSVGTPEYMAPEQASAKTVDHRADIYALGVVLYEMVTGRRPYEADTPLAVLVKHASEPLPRPKAFAPDLPERVEKVLLKALSKKPEDRYQSMGALAIALEELTAGIGKSTVGRDNIPPRPPVRAGGQDAILPHPPAPRLPRSKMPWLIGLGLAGLVAVSLLIGWLAGRPAAIFTTRAPASTMTAPLITQVVQVTQVLAITQVIPSTQIVHVTQATQPIASEVEVSANQGWQNTGIEISSGDVVTVEYVSGTWTGGIGAGRWYDGRGDLTERYKCAEKAANLSTCKEPMPYVYNGALIGKVGDSLIEIGNYAQFTSNTGGNLLLRMNDHDQGLFDNDGSIVVLVSVQHTGQYANVIANQGWQSTGIEVSLGDIVTVEYISGTWTGGIGASRWYDGRGDLIERYKCAEKAANPSTCKEPMPHVYNGALIGKVDDILVEIGNYLQFTSTTGGNLLLRMNDHDQGLFDNDGSIIVRVSVQH